MLRNGIDMEIDKNLASEYFDQNGRSLHDLCENPTLLVFLRHQGCTFCRETVSELSEKKEQFESTGIKIAFVTGNKKINKMMLN